MGVLVNKNSGCRRAGAGKVTLTWCKSSTWRFNGVTQLRSEVFMCGVWAPDYPEHLICMQECRMQWNYTVLHKFRSTWDQRLCLWQYRDRDREEKKRGERESGTDIQACRSLLSSPRSCLFYHQGEAKEVTHTYKHSINLPATLLVLDTVPTPSVCLLCCHPAVISLQPVPGYTAMSTEVPVQQMPNFLHVLCQNFNDTQLCYMSVYCAKRGFWQRSWQNMSRLMEIIFMFPGFIHGSREGGGIIAIVRTFEL